jgi:hypothetical protein
MRSFRAENVSLLVKQILDLDANGARRTLSQVEDRYPIVITRDLTKAKGWLKSQARGTERFGIMVSRRPSGSVRAIFAAPMDPGPLVFDGRGRAVV